MKTISLNQIGQKSLPLIGHKAFNLAKLSKVNISVPQFFVVPTSLFDQVVNNKSIKNLLLNLQVQELTSLGKNNQNLKSILDQIYFQISQYQFPSDLTKTLTRSFYLLKSDKLAIRSSANCEDSGLASFAGQFTSFLSVDKNDLLSAVKQCLAAVFNQQVLMYCSYHQVNFSDIKMAVIIQKMINADKGGVIFTKDVFNHSKNKLIIEAAQGLGENVVSGLVNPQKLIFDKKTEKIIEGFQGSDQPILTPKEAKQLFRLSLKIEKLFGSPQDIEWAIENNQIYILQSRPIT